MEMKISENLKRLSKLLGGELYIVGGFVRNAILNLGNTDIDLTGVLLPSEVKEILKEKSCESLETTEKTNETTEKTEEKSCETFKIIDDYSSFGSLLIVCGNEKFEYTTFRQDSYSGGHRPAEVLFTTDIKIDALRRDFTCNAVFYKIDENVIIDPLGGVLDIEKRRLVSCNGEKTFVEDGLRIMRMIRISGELGFEIEEKTLNFAKNNVAKLAEISKERIRDEFDKILVCDYKYGAGNFERVFNVIELLRKTGCFEIFLPQILLGVGMVQNAKYHEKDVYYHSLAVCCNCEKSLRLAGFLHDIAKPIVFLQGGAFHNHDKVGYELIKEILGQSGLKYPNSVVEHTARLSLNHMVDLKCEMKLRKLKLFILNNFDIIDDIIKIKIADGKGCKTSICDGKSVERLRSVLQQMRSEKLPFELRHLNISGSEILAKIGEENAKYISKILHKLQATVIVGELANDKIKLSDKILWALNEVKNVN